ncbi:sulfur carrier protein ThiS [Mycobacterium sp. NPDC006124]|uniref:sulfur carrier protein ThiS n=1 Tax=Mycobacterium sp. NPDC006124 TaxID=3156729 RepID=UPI0033AC8662
MRIVVNDESVEIDDGASVTDLLARLGLSEKGIAVAVDWAVVPRSQWCRGLPDGARVDVVTAVQGG